MAVNLRSNIIAMVLPIQTGGQGVVMVSKTMAIMQLYEEILKLAWPKATFGRFWTEQNFLIDGEKHILLEQTGQTNPLARLRYDFSKSHEWKTWNNA